MIDICKLTAALVFAAIAGLTAIAAGLLSDVRISVILMRTACIFLATGVLVYIGAFLFEKIGYGSLIKETEQAMRLAAHLYCVNLLSMLLEIGVITEEEFARIKTENAVFYKASGENCIKI